MSYFYKVEESTGAHYFTHEGIYSTEEAAKQEASKYPNARAVLYKTGGWRSGPVRVEDQP